MCGFAGLLGPAGDQSERMAMASRMAATLEHRGPDDAGAWADPNGECGLGSQRLAIIDVSPLGHQPMTSAEGRYTVAYNGEVVQLRGARATELEAAGCTFRGHSDTEVLLGRPDPWGIEAAIPRLWGMFAFGVWDAAGAAAPPRPRPARQEAALLRLAGRDTSSSARSSRRCGPTPRSGRRSTATR